MVPKGALESHLPVVFIAGSTATGKTDLALQLAQCYDVDLINVDAAQVYRGMDIGTAKLSAAQQARYPHQLIDICDPREAYDVSQFRTDAQAAIAKAHARGRLPVLVGGSLFYFSALENGVSALPKTDAETRREISEQAAELGWQALHQQLSQIDPASGKRIDPNDQQRIGRALELYRLTGEAPSAVMRRSKPEKLGGRLFKFNLYHPDRALLHQRIAKRFMQMLEQGLVEEVQALKNRGDLSLEMSSMRCVGYRQVWRYLDAKDDEQTMIDTSIAATRQLAKRQLTWLRNQGGQIWLDSTADINRTIIDKFLAPVLAQSGF